MKHYSPTQLNMFLRCEAQYRFRYLGNLKMPPSSALVQGRSIHKTEEFNFKNKIKTGADEPAKLLEEYYVSEFDTYIKNDIEWNEEERSVGVEKTKGKILDEGIGLVNLASKELNPNIQPKEVEKRYDVSFENTDYGLTVITDVEDSSNIIHELKTSAKTPSEVSQDYLLQGSAQALVSGKFKVKYNYLIKTKNPKFLQLEREFDSKDTDFFLGQVARMDKSIIAGVFMPNRASWSCSKSSCGFWNECEKVYGGRVKD